MRVTPVLAVAALATTVAGSYAAAEPGAPSVVSGTTAVGGVVDRTFVCATLRRGGVNVVSVRAHAGYPADGRWARLPYTAISTGVDIGGGLGDMIAWISAGVAAADTTVDFGVNTYAIRDWWTLGVRRGICGAARERVPLARGGLRGGSTTALGEVRTCPAPRAVLLRIRAVLPAQDRLNQVDDLLTTRDSPASATLAVRTRSGKPLVFAQVLRSGRTTLFTAKGCERD